VNRKPISAIRSLMEEYAHRGVFRSCSILSVRNGVALFRLMWFRDRIFELVVDTKEKTILVPALLPRPTEALYRNFKEFIRSHQSASLPDHRRIEKSKVVVRCARRQGNAALTFCVKDGDFGYALQRLIHLIHETYVIFLADGMYHDYRVAQLGESDW
jgi:hypothetical protein